MDAKQIEAELKRMHFVHCALPDLSLDEIKTELKAGNVELKNPIIILAKNEAEAGDVAKSEKEFAVAFVTDNKVYVIKNGGVEEPLPEGTYLVRAKDGLMAAKILRYDTRALPYVPKTMLKNAEVYLKQLKMAMFLTNSENIEKVRIAPVYIV